VPAREGARNPACAITLYPATGARHEPTAHGEGQLEAAMDVPARKHLPFSIAAGVELNCFFGAALCGELSDTNAQLTSLLVIQADVRLESKPEMAPVVVRAGVKGVPIP
jgi:hypothetical protein